MSDTEQETNENRAVAPLGNDRFEIAALQDWHADVDTDKGPIFRAARLTFIVVFVIGGIWSCTVPLGGAVIGSGRVIAEDRNRVIQHLEGGILEAVAVREGDHVTADDVLATMDTTQVRSQLDNAQVQQAILKVQLARRQAEVADETEVILPDDLDPLVTARPRVNSAIESQMAEFDAARKFRDSQISALRSRITGKNTDISSLTQIAESFEKQAVLLRLELADQKDLLEKGLTRRSQVYALERTLLQTEARIANAEFERTKAASTIIELGDEINKIVQGYLREANNDIIESQKRLTEVDEAVIRLADQLRRATLRSPVEGTVFRIARRTPGAVLSPGEVVMEIFPDNDALTVEVFVEPKDIENVYIGQDVDVVFPSDRKKALPPLPGAVTYVSADTIVSDRSPQGLYVAHVKIAMDAEESSGRTVLPGNTAEVYFRTTPKTLMRYVTEPITRFAFRAFTG